MFKSNDDNGAILAFHWKQKTFKEHQNTTFQLLFRSSFHQHISVIFQLVFHDVIKNISIGASMATTLATANLYNDS